MLVSGSSVSPDPHQCRDQRVTTPLTPRGCGLAVLEQVPAHEKQQHPSQNPGDQRPGRATAFLHGDSEKETHR